MVGERPSLEEFIAGREEQRTAIEEAYRMAMEVLGPRIVTRPVVQDYEIVRELGRGSMGQVYLARQIDLDRLVALKVLPQGAALSQRSRQRFVEEARALAKLQHDNIVKVHEVIEEGDVLAYAMEWVDGLTLRQVLDQLRDSATDDLAEILGGDPAAVSSFGGESPMKCFVRLGVTIGHALHTVHEAGMVHRDVKPSNILIRRDGTPLLADFGLARGSDSDLTRTGTFVGTPIYAPFEQLQPVEGFEVDRRADVYALCVTLYEATSGVAPFQSNSTADMLARIEAGAIPRLRKAAPQAPAISRRFSPREWSATRTTGTRPHSSWRRTCNVFSDSSRSTRARPARCAGSAAWFAGNSGPS